MRCNSISHPKFDSIQVPKGLRSGEEEDSTADDVKNRLFVKILASNAAAGSIIGKMGVNIHGTQATTGAQIQLSKPTQLFPGTKDRTLLIQGNLCQLASAVYSIFIRLIEEGCAPTWTFPKDECDGGGSDRERTGRGVGKKRGLAAPSLSTASTASTEVGSGNSLGDNAVSTPGRQSAEGRERKELAEAAGANDSEEDTGAGDEVGKELKDTDDAENKDTEPKKAVCDSAGNTEERGSEDRKTAMDLSEYVAKAPLQVKLLIPEEFIGYIVGRSGVNVTNICTTTHTSIKVFPQPVTVNLTHQIVSIRGHLVDIIKAISMIVLKQADDQEYYGYANIPLSYIKMPAYGSRMMPVYHPSPGTVGYMGSSVMPGASVRHDMHAVVGVPSHLSGHNEVHAPGPSGQFVSMMVPLVPEQQSELLKNMGVITQTIQSSTGILLKLESIPGHAGFSVRLDGPREWVMMAINILLPQISYHAAAGDSYAPMSPPISPPVARDTPSPFNERHRWHSESPE